VSKRTEVGVYGSRKLRRAAMNKEQESHPMALDVDPVAWDKTPMA
jgi:hypothetical protein